MLCRRFLHRHPHLDELGFCRMSHHLSPAVSMIYCQQSSAFAAFVLNIFGTVTHIGKTSKAETYATYNRPETDILKQVMGGNVLSLASCYELSPCHFSLLADRTINWCWTHVECSQRKDICISASQNALLLPERQNRFTLVQRLLGRLWILWDISGCFLRVIPCAVRIKDWIHTRSKDWRRDAG